MATRPVLLRIVVFLSFQILLVCADVVSIVDVFWACSLIVAKNPGRSQAWRRRRSRRRSANRA